MMDGNNRHHYVNFYESNPNGAMGRPSRTRVRPSRLSFRHPYRPASSRASSGAPMTVRRASRMARASTATARMVVAS